MEVRVWVLGVEYLMGPEQRVKIVCSGIGDFVFRLTRMLVPMQKAFL